MKTLLSMCLVVLSAVCGATVSHFEYFFDTDPGPGNGIQLYERHSLELDELISTTGLSPGFHRIYIRAVSDGNVWGLPQRTTFYLPVPNPSNVTPDGTVAELEYFFNTDPGPGNGISIYGRHSVNVDELISTASLDPGFHRIFVRAKSATGSWGLPQRTVFYIPVPVQPRPPIVNITHLEYYLDTDPGVGLGIQLPFPVPGTSVDHTFALDMNGIPHGNHDLYVRLKNTVGTFGLPQTAIFSDGVPAHFVCSVSGNDLTLDWESLHLIDTYKVYWAPEPAGPFNLDSSGVFDGSSWTAPLPPDPRRFFRVTSVHDLR